MLAPSTINPAVPAALDAIVMKALAKAPRDRWQSAAELAAALERVVATLGFGRSELGAEMASLFGEEARAYHDAQLHTPPRGAGPLGDEHEHEHEHDTVPMPRIEGATLAELRGHAPRRRMMWRLLLAAAALASLAVAWR